MTGFKGFLLNVVDFVATKHEWKDVSKQVLRFESIRFNLNRVELEVLDQILLPSQTRYIPINSVHDAFEVIQKMNVRGAPLIAIVALLGLCVELEHKFDQSEDLMEFLEKQCSYLCQSRPTAVNLANEILKLKEFAKGLDIGASVEDKKHQIYNYIYNLYTAEREENDRLLRNATICVEHNVAPKFNNQPLNVMTICNTGALATCSLGTALGVIRCLHQRGRLNTAYCLETRPYNQGSRLTAYELYAENIPHCLISDSMAASVMRSKQIHAVLVGADQVALNGDTANKIGTYMLAILAKYHGVPFYVVTPVSSINSRIETGVDIKIEERGADELRKFNGAYIAPPECTVYNPAFDITTADLISAILTDKGNVKPADVKKLFS